MVARRRLPLLVAALALTAGTATACTDANGTNGKNYVAGDGAVIEIDPGDRGDPVDARGETLDRRPARPGRLTAARSWWSTCGGRVPAVPHGGAAAGRRRRRAARRRHDRRASTSGTPARTTRWPSSAGSACPTPRSTTPAASLLLELPVAVQPARHAQHGGPRPPGPGRRADPRRDPLQADPDRRWSRRRRPRMDDWLRETAFSGSMVARGPGRGPRRAGVLLLAVRDPAAARATSPTRPGSPAPTSPTPRPNRAAAGCSPARRCSCSASRSSSSAWACCRRA